MVVADLAVIDDTGRIHAESRHRKRQGGRRQLTQRRNGVFHILRQIVGIRPWVGQQLFLIQRLGVVKHLLGGIAKQPVPVPLKRSQVIELGRLCGLLLLFHRLHNSRLRAAGG